MPNKNRRIKVRRSWVIHPRTRVKQSGKAYSRHKLKSEIKRIVKGEV